MSKTTMIPAGKEIRLSQEIYYYMLMQVPQGRLTRDCDIREYNKAIGGDIFRPALIERKILNLILLLLHTEQMIGANVLRLIL